MKTKIGIHIVQNFAPGNLNSNADGSPKTSSLGKVDRSRISNQCYKRAVRKHFKEKYIENLSFRTENLVDIVSEKLKLEHGLDFNQARDITKNAIKDSIRVGFKTERGKTYDTNVLLFLGDTEINSIVHEINEHWDAAEDVRIAQMSDAIRGRMNDGMSIDVALYGRMLAGGYDININASCQMPDAIGTHALKREFDFFTAMDDAPGEGDKGAVMMGVTEYNSSCYYRCAFIDVDSLLKNLAGSTELTLEALHKFMDSMIYATPKDSVCDAPSYVCITVQDGGEIFRMTNAFVPAIKPKSDESMIELSAKALKRYYDKVAIKFNLNATCRTVHITNAPDGDVVIGECVNDIQALIELSVADVEEKIGAVR